MTRRHVFRTWLVLGLGLGALLLGCAQAPPPAPTSVPKAAAPAAAPAPTAAPKPAQQVQLRFASGPVGGLWNTVAGSMGEILRQKIPGVEVTVRTGTGIGNIEAIETDQADIALTYSFLLNAAMKQEAPFKTKAQRTLQTAALYMEYDHVVVLDDSGIKSVADLKGKNIAPGLPGSGDDYISEQVLKAYGLSYKDMANVHRVSYPDAVSLMKDKRADAFLHITGLPGPAETDLATARKTRLLGHTDDKIKALQQLNAGFTKLAIPANTYPGIDYEVPTIGSASMVVLSSKLSDDLAYNITKALLTSTDTLGTVAAALKVLTPKSMAQDVGAPPHPGALKYYQEMKLR